MKLSEKELQAMLREVDINGDGRVSCLGCQLYLHFHFICSGGLHRVLKYAWGTRSVTFLRMNKIASGKQPDIHCPHKRVTYRLTQKTPHTNTYYFLFK